MLDSPNMAAVVGSGTASASRRVQFLFMLSNPETSCNWADDGETKALAPVSVRDPETVVPAAMTPRKSGIVQIIASACSAEILSSRESDGVVPPMVRVLMEMAGA